MIDTLFQHEVLGMSVSQFIRIPTVVVDDANVDWTQGRIADALAGRRQLLNGVGCLIHRWAPSPTQAREEKEVVEMVRRLDPVDVVIVGLGAGGGPAAKVLAEAGYSVVGFDKGPWLRTKEHYSGDELKFQNRSYLWPDVDLMPRTVRRDENPRVASSTSRPSPRRSVAGRRTWPAGRPARGRRDFIMRSLHGDVEGASLADWPFRYEHLEPYLTKVEWATASRGSTAPKVGAVPLTGRTPAPRCGPTQFGKFYDGCRTLGINAFPLPMTPCDRAQRTRPQGRQPDELLEPVRRPDGDAGRTRGDDLSFRTRWPRATSRCAQTASFAR